MAGTTKCSHTLYWQDLLNHISILSTITQAPSTTIWLLCAAQEFMTPEFKKQWFRKKAHELPADAELVSCVPLGLVLEMFGIRHIDFLSLDVEVMQGDSFVKKLNGLRIGRLLGCETHSTNISVRVISAQMLHPKSLSWLEWRTGCTPTMACVALSLRQLETLQGAELEVLKTVNLTQVSVDVLVIEMDGSNPGKDEAVRELLAANHFEQDKAMKNTKAGLRNEWFIGEMFSPKVCPHCRGVCASYDADASLTCELEGQTAP